MNETPYHFDESSAHRVKNFIETCCRQTVGKWAGQPLQLLPWQWDDLIKPLFGWKDSNNLRKYRQASVWIPRRNGKTVLLAAIALYLLLADGEQAAQVYIVANTIEQGRNCFDSAIGMVRQSPGLSKRCIIRTSQKRILVPSTNSKLAVLSSDADSLLGVNCSALIADEIGFFKKRELITNLRGSQLNRLQPLLLTISTASDCEGIGREQFEYAQKVKAGVFHDDTFLPVIYSAPYDADWTSPEVWRQANPSLNETVPEKELALLCQEAMREPRKENEFRMFHLNQWCFGGAAAWITTPDWQACKEPFTEEFLAGRKCFTGLDLARRHDLAAVVHVFPVDGRYYLLPRFFMPKDCAHRKEDVDRFPYLSYARQNFITLTPGDVIDYAMIRETIKADSQKFRIEEIAYDPYGAELLCNQQLRGEDGLNCVEMRTGILSMSPPSMQFERLLKERKIVHNGNPVLTWNAGNVTVRTDTNGNLMPDKRKGTARIDGIVSAIMGLSRALTEEDAGPFFGTL